MVVGEGAAVVVGDGAAVVVGEGAAVVVGDGAAVVVGEGAAVVVGEGAAVVGVVPLQTETAITDCNIKSLLIEFEIYFNLAKINM